VRFLLFGSRGWIKDDSMGEARETGLPLPFDKFLLLRDLAGKSNYCTVSIRHMGRLIESPNLHDRFCSIVEPREHFSIDKSGWFEVHCKVHKSVVEVVVTPNLHTGHKFGVVFGVVILAGKVEAVPSCLIFVH
jgi:hypothetical protein